MGYIVGLILAVTVICFAAVVGFDRERAFYPTVACVNATYYILFAAMGASRGTLLIESSVVGVFFVVAALGFRINCWLVPAALVGHAVFDWIHHSFLDNPGVPRWWPAFCLAFDVTVGVYTAVHLVLNPKWAKPTRYPAPVDQ